MAWIWLFLISLVTYLVVKYKLSQKNPPLPPGPPADPILGHLRSFPPAGQDMYFYELGRKYGDVVHLRVLGQSMIILNSVQAAIDLLDKRGAINTNPGQLTLLPTNSLGIGHSTALERYGTGWRKQRAMVQQHFHKEKSKEYHHIQTREAHVLALKLLATTEDKTLLFLRFSTAVIIDIAYGRQLKPSGDPFLQVADECSEILANAGPPGGTLVDLFPILCYFPSWFPGTYYATYARKYMPKMIRIFDHPYNQVKEEMSKGIARPSFLASLLEEFHAQGAEDEEDIKLIKYASGTVYIGGAETTSSALSFFLLAMILYPEFQTKAQEEIDHLIGPGRLPELHDRDSLPYLECILQETLRWHQPLPAGVPHRSTEDDVYDGMLIPKGSMIIANARAMGLDETLYKDPFKFDPARFLPAPEGRGEPHPTAHFGFGRRICPGRYLAEDSVWIVIATILSTTRITKAIGEDGKEIIPEEVLVTTGATSHPRSVPCQMEPRTEESLKILRQFVDSEHV